MNHTNAIASVVAFSISPNVDSWPTALLLLHIYLAALFPPTAWESELLALVPLYCVLSYTVFKRYIPPIFVVADIAQNIACAAKLHTVELQAIAALVISLAATASTLTKRQADSSP